MKKILLGLWLISIFSFSPMVLEKNAQAAIELPDVGLSKEAPEAVLGKILDKLLTIFIILAIIAFIITGIMFLVSVGGATGTNQQAKQYFFYAIIGLVIGLSALIILNAVMGLFGGGAGGSNGGGNNSLPTSGRDVHHMINDRNYNATPPTATPPDDGLRGGYNVPAATPPDDGFRSTDPRGL